jgi:hypothetical protein
MPDLAVLRGFPPCRNRGDPYIVHCNTAIGVAVLLPFLGVSSLNFGPLATAAFFLIFQVFEGKLPHLPLDAPF